MDFARKQLEKYGWTDGKGLGKHENGISEALKPKLKRSVAGIGHDPASDFTEHWWSTLYNKAADNVQVEEKNGRTKKIKIKDEQFKITNSTFHLKKKQNLQNDEEYADYFIKKSILTGGGNKTEKVRDSESEEEVETTEFKMTDEELFAACEGRTAHKGARHGLRALGKLARIERQEQMLLNQPQYNGYSHSKKKKKKAPANLQVIENMNINTEEECQTKSKKKQRKRRISGSNNTKSGKNNSINVDMAQVLDAEPETEKKVSRNSEGSSENTDASSKSKKRKRKNAEIGLNEVSEIVVMPEKRKKRKDKRETSMEIQTIVSDQLSEEVVPKVKKNKKKKKHLFLTHFLDFYELK